MADENNAAEVFSRPNKEAKILDLEQFTLWAETPNRPNFRSRLQFGERNGAPRITVFTNFEKPLPQVVYVGMDPVTFEDFLMKFETIAKGSNDKKDRIENMMRPKDGNGQTDINADLIVMNTLNFGKDKDGVCWIWVTQSNLPDIRFSIMPTVWHRYYDEHGSMITPKAASANYTGSFIRALRTAIGKHTGRLRQPIPRADQGAPGYRGAPRDTPMPSSIASFDDVKFG